MTPELQYGLIGLLIGAVLGVLAMLVQVNGQKNKHSEELRSLENSGAAQRAELERKLAETGPKLERLVKVEADLEAAHTALRDAEGRASSSAAQAEERSALLTAKEDRISQLQIDLDAKIKKISDFESDQARLQEQVKAAQKNVDEQRLTLIEAEKRLKEAFGALSGEALKTSQEQFITAAEQVLKQYTEGAKNEFEKKSEDFGKLLDPLKDKLTELDRQNQEMEKSRASAYSELKQQVQSLSTQQVDLTKETSRLVKALQDPGTAGSWGEMILEKVVELAGLPEGIVYDLQETSSTDEGRQRPDMAIKLPGDRCLIVDSKAPLKGYLDALESEDEAVKAGLLKELPRKLLGHAQELKKRSYDKRVETPDFTVMFIPSESAFRVALEQRPGLIEEVIDLRVIMATPSTMLALLKVVAYGWRQDRLTQTAKQVQEQAQKLYETIVTLMSHYEKLGKALNNAGKAYNDFGASLNTRVVPAARRFRDLGLSAKNEVSDSELVEFSPRPLTAPDFQAKPESPALEGGLFPGED